MSTTNINPPPVAPSSPSPTDPGTSPESLARWRSIFYGTSLGLTFLCPVVMLLPPRKLDLYTFGLGITWCVSASYCVEQRTGRPLLWHIGDRLPSAANRARHRHEAEARREAERRGLSVEQVDGERRTEAGGSVLRSLWWGKKNEGWAEERMRKEREALERGEGYGSLIKQHIREAVVGEDESEKREGK